MRTLISLAVLFFISAVFSPLALTQVQDLHLSVEQFKKINKAKEDVKKIKKGVTVESEIKKMFGKESVEFLLEEPVTKEDETVFIGLLQKHIPAELKPEYPFPNIKQKVFMYIIPWTFEHPVPDRTGKGERVQTENLVLLVTINKKTGIVEDSKFFDFYFYTKWEGKKS